MCHLTESNLLKAQSLLDNGQDYCSLASGLMLIVAYDSTVWVCQPNGVCIDKATMIQRII